GKAGKESAPCPGVSVGGKHLASSDCQRNWRYEALTMLPCGSVHPDGGFVPCLGIRRSLLAGRCLRSSCRDILMSSLTTAMPISVDWQRCWIGSVAIRNRISTHDKFRLPVPTANGWILERASSLN